MPTVFSDNRDRTWNLALSYTAARRVREMTGVNLLAGAEAFKQLLADPFELVHVVAAICADQINEKGLSELDFGEALDGDVIEAATDAFLEAFINFTPPAKRPALKMLLEKLKQLDQQRTARAMNLVESGELDRLAQQEMTTTEEKLRTAIGPTEKTATSGSSSGSSPASSASTPDR